jgi:hypothetical protein
VNGLPPDADHRIGKKWHNIQKIPEGNFDPIAKAFQKGK